MFTVFFPGIFLASRARAVVKEENLVREKIFCPAREVSLRKGQKIPGSPATTVSHLHFQSITVVATFSLASFFPTRAREGQAKKKETIGGECLMGRQSAWPFLPSPSATFRAREGREEEEKEWLMAATGGCTFHTTGLGFFSLVLASYLPRARGVRKRPVGKERLTGSM